MFITKPFGIIVFSRQINKTTVLLEMLLTGIGVGICIMRLFTEGGNNVSANYLLNV